MTLQISQYNEQNTFNMENQINPDNQFLNSINNNCRYYTNDQLNNISKDGQLSIIHINCRSLYANFTDIKDYLGQFTQPFTVIALSETWINSNRRANFEMDGYEFIHMDWQNKSGGGVALYTDKNINFRTLQNTTTTVNNVVELVQHKKKSVIISCL